MEALPLVPVRAYAVCRGDLHQGDLLMCAGTSPMSRMIQAATASPWSHVGVLLRIPEVQRVLVLESVESIGVRAVPLSTGYVTDYNGTGRPYPGRIFVGRHHGVPQDVTQLTIFAQQAVDLLGTKYDTREVLSIALRIVAAKLGLPPPPQLGTTLPICSEYAQHCFASIGLVIPRNRTGYIAPCDFVALPEVEILWEIDLESDDNLLARRG